MEAQFKFLPSMTLKRVVAHFQTFLAKYFAPSVLGLTYEPWVQKYDFAKKVALHFPARLPRFVVMKFINGVRPLYFWKSTKMIWYYDDNYLPSGYHGGGGGGLEWEWILNYAAPPYSM